MKQLGPILPEFYDQLEREWDTVLQQNVKAQAIHPHLMPLSQQFEPGDQLAFRIIPMQAGPEHYPGLYDLEYPTVYVGLLKPDGLLYFWNGYESGGGLQPARYQQWDIAVTQQELLTKQFHAISNVIEQLRYGAVYQFFSAQLDRSGYDHFKFLDQSNAERRTIWKRTAGTLLSVLLHPTGFSLICVLVMLVFFQVTKFITNEPDPTIIGASVILLSFPLLYAWLIRKNVKKHRQFVPQAQAGYSSGQIDPTFQEHLPTNLRWEYWTRVTRRHCPPQSIWTEQAPRPTKELCPEELQRRVQAASVEQMLKDLESLPAGTSPRLAPHRERLQHTLAELSQPAPMPDVDSVIDYQAAYLDSLRR